MNGNLIYEMARQRLAEQRWSAQQAADARGRRAVARGRHTRPSWPDAVKLPSIPDFAHQMFGSAEPDPAAEQPQAPARGRHARSDR